MGTECELITKFTTVFSEQRDKLPVTSGVVSCGRCNFAELINPGESVRGWAGRDTLNKGRILLTVSCPRYPKAALAILLINPTK